MRNFLLGQDLREENLLPGYFFHGEEMFLARQFIRSLQNKLVSPDVQGISLENFNLGETTWRDIMDVARTIPFFFSPWRILVVEISSTEMEDLKPVEGNILKEYFASPTLKTILIVLFHGKIRRTKPLFRIFSSLSSSAVLIQEVKSLKNEALFEWIDQKLAAAGKRAGSEAVDRLTELVGGDLQRLDNELEKLVTYVGDKRSIELDDVNQLSDWNKDFLEWELAASLEKGDLERSLMILNKRFQEGDRPEHVLYNLASFLRDLLAAKVWLKENRDRKEIFGDLKPQITEKMGRFYWTKLHEFFSLVDSFSQKDVSRFLAELEQIDLKIKTSDVSAQTLFETFFYEYGGRIRRRKSAISPARD
jgi:DNA polymerase-3 subunit delta